MLHERELEIKLNTFLGNSTELFDLELQILRREKMGKKINISDTKQSSLVSPFCQLKEGQTWVISLWRPRPFHRAVGWIWTQFFLLVIIFSSV